ncbi:MAG: hypothetical protein CVT49_05950 [candidate division Zixibacteria bacterium HGW-Zixibacteria-1]|nr:MAG: hypothetical protein CVT49_05950 [candidate division Zixibacteria bacterium HGW-Zixibacteria-1]
MINKLTPSLLLIILILIALPGFSANAVVEGLVTDYDSGEPVPFATIRVEGTGRSMVANQDGQYRLMLKPGQYQLKFSHIAHYSEKVNVDIVDSVLTLDIRLRPSVLTIKGMKVYQRAYDPAQRIIVEAIDRKDDILSRLKSYSFDAYTKLVVRDTAKADSENIRILTETQVKYFWQYPDKQKEIITARKQSANLSPEQNLVSVGGILNLNRNRLDIDKYSIVSPTARDALDHYNYYLLDTIYIDSTAIFRLEVEPKSQSRPLFYGTIDIVDSQFAVVGADLGFNDVVDLPFIDSLRFRQSFAQFDNNYWMPIEQRMAALVDITFPGIPVFRFDYAAAIHNYRFDVEFPDNTFDEYILEVAEDADNIDSSAWLASQLIPLTENELGGYKRIDSLENVPKSIAKIAARVGLGAIALTIAAYDYFHFNRVEGPYLGAAFSRRELFPRLDVALKTGWAFDGEYWQHRYAFDYTLSKRQALKVGIEYRDLIARRPTIISSPAYNPTLFSLLNRYDNLDYYHERGFEVGVETKVINQTRVSIIYNDFDQLSAPNNTTFSFFDNGEPHRLNPRISPGKLRAVTGQFTWDSRPLMKSKRQIQRLQTIPYTIFKAGIEYASPDFIDNDFEFSKYYLMLERRQRTLGLGISSLSIYAGASDKILPPQRYFTVDFGAEEMVANRSFKTLGENNFIGNRAALVYLDHNFGRLLFKKSGLPLIKNIPFSLSLNGGIFWTDFHNQDPLPDDQLSMSAARPYSEIGFGIGRLPLMNMKLLFTWQLSDYNTEDFSVDLGIEF